MALKALTTRCKSDYKTQLSLQELKVPSASTDTSSELIPFAERLCSTLAEHVSEMKSLFIESSPGDPTNSALSTTPPENSTHLTRDTALELLCEELALLDSIKLNRSSIVEKNFATKILLNVESSDFLNLIPSLIQADYIYTQTCLVDKLAPSLRLDTPFLHPLLFFYRNMLIGRESDQLFDPILISVLKLVSSMTDYTVFLSIPRIDSTNFKSPLEDAMVIIHDLIGPIFERTHLLMESSFLQDCKKFLIDPRYSLEHYSVIKILYRLSYLEYPDVSPSYIANHFESSSTATTVFQTFKQSSLTIQDRGSDGVFFFCLRMIVNLIFSSGSLAISFLDAGLLTPLQTVLSNVHQRIYTEIMYVFTNLSDCSVDVVLKTLISGNIPYFLAHFLGRITNAYDLATLLASVERFAIISKRSAQISEIAHLQLDSTFIQQAAKSDLPNLVSALISHNNAMIKHYAERALTSLTDFEK
ncbi:hypothetical protein BLNAU_17579 [Blattamonas nauphoetae]|uniref:DNA mismatch repair protein HSM3 n=1 Tax=Blattamonas nauphoetae TaxID=2049346 RepID=A0ABQ9X793_9EUKA|nr:hypothetical protein BLNAU_17579 [Blattamonas nauphoetae]